MLQKSLISCSSRPLKMELNFRNYKEAVKISSNLEVILVESILDFKRFSASVTHEIESVLVVQLFKLSAKMSTASSDLDFHNRMDTLRHFS